MAAAVLVVAGGTLWLATAPQPAAAGPVAGSATATGEAAPHVHVTMAGMAGMTGASVPVGGTASSGGGYTLVPAGTSFAAGVAATFTFHVTGPDGAPVTRFVIERDKPLHLIVVRDDLTGYQHIHPTMAPDGTWSVPLTLAQPGRYRAYADFTAQNAAGAQVSAVLGVDLTVAGPLTAAPLPGAARSDTVGGDTVSYQGSPVVGTVEPLLFEVSAGGVAVTPEPYLGAYGHLVAIRTGDLGYLHIHPEPTLSDGAVKFWLAAPGAGTYRMYFDFQVSGVVHTAQFTVVVS